MRFSICCTSISPSTSPTSSSRRSNTSTVSSSRCLSARRTPRCAAMVSARRPGSSIPDRVWSSSGGSLRLDFTYCSNSDISERATASISRGSRSPVGSTTCARQVSVPSRSATLSTVARSTPSTSTLMVPSGSLSNCSTVARVPTPYRSAAPGSSTSADFCATSAMRRSPSIASSSARMDFSRPTNSGMTMCGNTTTSRSGSTGRVAISGRSGMSAPVAGGASGALSTVMGPWRGGCKRRSVNKESRPWNGRLFNDLRDEPRVKPTALLAGGGLGRRRGLVDQVGLGLVLDHRLVHDHLAHVLQRRQVVHGVQQHRLDDGAQAAGTGLALERLARDRGQRVRAELQLHALHVEQLAELLGDRVPGLAEDLNQRGLVQFLQGRDHRQAADELGDQAELDQVLGLDLGQHLADLDLAFAALELGAEADAAGLGAALLDDLVQAGEGAADDEQDVAGVHLQEFLLRVLAPALRRDRGDGALDQLQQRLLHALARDVAGDGRVLGLARDLVDLVDVDDALLRLLDVVVALLQQLLDDVLDVLADVAGLGEGRRVGHGERHVQQAREGLGQQRLARAGGPDQQDVGLGQLDVVVLLLALDPLVVVVHRHRERLLGPRLADHVLVQDLEDLLRLGQRAARRLGLFLELLADDV